MKAQPADIYSPDPNLLERTAAGYLARWTEATAPRADSPAGADADTIRNATRRAVTLAAAAGVVSGAIIGGSEVWIRQGVFDGLEDVGWREQLPYWIGFFALAGVISAIEIAFLYWLSLRGIARVADCAGVAVGGDGYPGLFARGLARRALEFPNPYVHVFGIDPYAYVPYWQLLAKNIAYKLKVGVSSFLLRVFLRRIAARMAIRGFIPLLAAPLYAAWNAFTVWRIMHEARIRALGPQAVADMLGEIFGGGRRPGDDAAAVMLHGAAEMMRRARDAHPTHVYLLARLREELDHAEKIDVDWSGRRDELRRLDDAERSQVLAMLVVVVLVSSKITAGQKNLLREACSEFGGSLHEGELKALRGKFKSGRPVRLEDLVRVGRRGA